MITARCTGGIGNRLFQISAAIKYAEELKREPVLFLPCLIRSEHNSYSLLFDLLPHIKTVESESSITLQEEGSINCSSSTILVLKGYFQDMRFFPSINSPLLPTLPLPIPFTPQKSVAIHFRFGDYMDLKHHQVNLSSYYMKAIKMFPPNTHFIVFSDSPEKLGAISRELWTKGYSNSIDKSKSVLQTFQEIAKCSTGFIGSNSTFAWWAAFFAYRSLQLDTYIAYFPDTWMADGYKPNLFTEAVPYTRALPVTASQSATSAFERLNSFSYSKLVH